MTIIITFSFPPFTSFLSVCLSVSLSLQLRNDSNYNHRDTVRGSLVLLSHRQKEVMPPEHVCKSICDHRDMTHKIFTNDKQVCLG